MDELVLVALKAKQESLHSTVNFMATQLGHLKRELRDLGKLIDEAVADLSGHKNKGEDK